MQEARIRSLRIFAACLLFLAEIYPAAGMLHLWRTKNAEHPLLVGYFPQWGFYYDQPYYAKALLANHAIDHLDQINYAQGFVTNGKCSVADPNADLNIAYTAQNSVDGKADDPRSPFRGYFHQLREMKRRYPHVKILISLEGKAADFEKDALPENRGAFVSSCIDIFVRGNFAAGIHEPGLFDGFDIDWEYPKEPDAADFQALLEEFRRQMIAVRSDLRLSIAVGHSPHMQPGTDFAKIAAIVDQVGIMNYDYTGPWNNSTGFLAPLFADPADTRHKLSIERDVLDFEAAGVPAQKLLMGMPFYGYSWSEVADVDHGRYQAGHGVRSDQPYNYIKALAPKFSVYRDERSQAPWLYDGKTFWTYEDAVSVRYKASYAANQHLGGIMIWDLGGDTTDGLLLNTAWKAFRDPIAPEVFAKWAAPVAGSAPATAAEPHPQTAAEHPSTP